MIDDHRFYVARLFGVKFPTQAMLDAVALKGRAANMDEWLAADRIMRAISDASR